MPANREAFRRMILGKLYDHLSANYSCVWPRDPFVEAHPPFHDIDAILSFKSDMLIESLRMALDRIDEGRYGVCLGCRTDIPLDLLDEDPVRRFCTSCERSFSRYTRAPYAAAGTSPAE